MPSLSGLVPYVLEGEIDVNYLPDQKQAEKMSLTQRNKNGFSMGIQNGIDIVFGMGSVIMKMTEQFVASPDNVSFRSLFQNTFTMNRSLIKAWFRNKVFKKPVLPKDIWQLKGLVHAGTDSYYLKDQIEYYWGVKPLEIFGGTGPSFIATDVWNKDGMVMFPFVCFYEFLSSSERIFCEMHPEHTPKTCLMDELIAGETYELVFSNFKGGAFMRYRSGYLFLCLSVTNEKEGIMFPQFRYLDRLSTVIDIAGFIRISQQTIEHTIELSKLPISDWFAVKEYNADHRPYLHLFVEMYEDIHSLGINARVIEEQLMLYFLHLDLDKWDIKSFFGLDPMVVSILPQGTIENFEYHNSHKVQKINPSAAIVNEILNTASLNKKAV
jgi:hypothetical protein